MPAPVVRQSTPFYAPGTAWAAGGTATLSAWPRPTLIGSRIVVFGGITNNGVDSLTLTSRIGGTVPPYSASVIRQSSGHDEVSFYAWQSLNTGGTVAAPKLVNAGTVAAYLWGMAVEVTGDDNTRDEDIAFTVATGAGTAFTLGPTILPDQGDILYLGGAAIPNVQALALQAGSGWSVIDQGGSGSTGNSAKATGLIAQLSRTGLAAAQVGLTVPSGNTRQYAGGILAIPATTTSGGGGGGGGGGGFGGSPQSFPLGPPDMTGAVTLNDPDHTKKWTPTDPSLPSGLKSGVKYILNCPVQRGAPISIVGGSHVYIPKLLIRLTASISGPMFQIGGGDANSIIHLEQGWLDPNGFQCDATKTQSPSSQRILQMKVVRIEKLIGQTSQVHADLLQASGGLKELWVEDFTGATTYDGFMMQREANVEQQTVSFPVTGGSVSGSNYVITSPSHTFVAGDPVGIWGASPSAYNGGFTVLSVAGSGSSKTFTVKKGDSSPGTITSNGHAEKMFFGFDVGSVNFNRVNVNGFHNALQNTAPLQCIRFGARTAPDPNSGSPGTVTGYTKQNEDETPFNLDQWSGTLDATDWYADPTNAQNLSDFVAPGGGTSVYSVIRPVQHAASGTVPIYVDWPNHPQVTGTTKLRQGAPPGGDFVIISGGLPIATAGTAPSGTAPAPVATSLPVITPHAPLANSVLGVADLGVWSNIDPTTIWSVAFQNSLGGTAAWSTVLAYSSLTAAQALAQTMGTAALLGYGYRLQVVANNAAPGTANSAASALVADASTVALIVEIE